MTELKSHEMAGEIAVIFNIPQPFTVRSKRLTQVIRIGHREFRLIMESHIEDGRKLMSNFIKVAITH